MSEVKHNFDRDLRQALALLETAGFTEDEIKARIEKAHVLLARHNLSEAQARAMDGNNKAPPVILDTDLLTDRAGWVKGLFGHLARLYFCKYYSEMWPAHFIKSQRLDVNNRSLLAGGHSKWFLRHNFVGRQADIVTVKAMAEYIISSMEAICHNEKKKWPRDEQSKFQTAFMNSCSLRLQYMMFERLESTKAPSVYNGETLPALNTLYEQAQHDAEAFLKDGGINLTTRKAVTSLHHAGGARAGREAAERIGLNNQVGGGSGGRKLLK